MLGKKKSRIAWISNHVEVCLVENKLIWKGTSEPNTYFIEYPKMAPLIL